MVMKVPVIGIYLKSRLCIHIIWFLIFRSAATKQEFCNLTQVVDFTDKVGKFELLVLTNPPINLFSFTCKILSNQGEQEKTDLKKLLIKIGFWF